MSDQNGAGLTVPLRFVKKYVGKKILDGQCASGVQQIFADKNGGNWVLGLTRTWRRGARVWGNHNVPEGTVIASFKPNGRYGYHTAIYAGQTEQGIEVYDQWANREGGFGPRVLRIGYRGGHPQGNKADYFYVVEKR